jgi:maltose alpha-D-glucosyltransferase/alpha-amylase
MAQHFLNVSSIDDVLRPDNRRAIETQALPDYLTRRRWFASKDQNIESVRLARADMFAMANGAILLTEIDVHLAGRSERYQLPLGLGS